VYVEEIAIHMGGSKGDQPCQAAIQGTPPCRHK
jgi:hypothetical protein